MLSLLIAAAATFATPKTCCDPMLAFMADPAFIATHGRPLPFKYKPVSGHDAVFPSADGKPAHGFFVPASNGSKVGIIMVHEYWGLNDYIKREAESVHDTTHYAVLAIDLYEGQVATDPGQAAKLMQGVEAARAKAIVKGAVTALKGGSLGFKASKIGTVGFCFGGGWSFQTAVQAGKDVNACVMFYGMPDTSPEALEAVKAPVLMIWAERDKWINGDVVEKFKTAMAGAHKPLTVKGYDADHAFANPSNPHYNADAAKDAMNLTFSFWKKYL